MILTIVGANFEGANIGQNNSVTITLSKTGANGSKESVTLKKGESVSLNTVIATGLSEASGYENLVVTVKMNGSTVSGWFSNGTVTIPSGTTITGNITITAIASKIATGGGEVVDPEEPGTGGGSGDASTATEKAQAFLTAANITDSETSNNIITLVTELMEENLWDKIDALYPCVGTTFEQMSYNLKDPSTFKMRARYDVAPSVDNTGILSDKLVVCDNYTTAPGNNFHTLAWNKIGYSTIEGLKIAICGVCIGEGLSDGGVQVQFYDNEKEGQAQIRTHGKEGRWNCKPCDVNPTGLVISSLTSGIIHNGVSIGAVKEGTPNLTINNVDIGINGMLGSKNYLGHRGLVGFGKGLTIEEMQKYSEILNNFKNIY